MPALIVLCSLAVASLAADPLGPGAGPWEVEDPSAHQLDGGLLDAGRAHVFTNAPTRNCFLVVKDGALVYEYYSSDTYNHTAHAGYSMTKTLGALVAGWSVTHSKLDIDKDITETYSVKSPKSYGVTSRHIMSQAIAGKDGPGEHWSYDAGGSQWINHMAQVVPAATGKKASQIWRENFQEPLGLSSAFSWSRPDSMWASGSSGTCRDYARVGQLMLNKGKWKGVDTPIVSADYVHQMGTPQTKYAPYANYSNPCYGLLTWLNTNTEKYPGTCLVPIDSPTPKEDSFPKGSPWDIFFAAGMYGQIVMVVPDHNAVVISMGRSADQNGVAHVLYEGVCKAFGDCKSDEPIVV